MRRTSPIALVLMLVLAVACSRSAEVESGPAPAMDPVGAYDFSLSMGGMTRTGEIHVQRTNGVLGGFATIEGADGEAPVTGVTVDGNRLNVEVTPPNGGGAVIFDLTFTGASFSGTINAEGQTFPVAGSKRPS